MLLAALSALSFSSTASAGEPLVAVSLRGDCRRPLPGHKTWTPCAAAHALNLIDEAGLLAASRAYDASLRSGPQASTATLVCLDDNAVEYLSERELLLKDLERLRAWAKAATDIAAEVEDPSCIESVGGYMIGGTKSDHPERMASNVAMSAWALTHHHAEALKRKGRTDLTDAEKAAAEKETKEFSTQREFLLDQLEGLQAWAGRATVPETPVAVKDGPLERVGPEELAKLEKTLIEMRESLKGLDGEMRRLKKKLDEMPKARKALMRPLGKPSELKPLKPKPK